MARIPFCDGETLQDPSLIRSGATPGDETNDLARRLDVDALNVFRAIANNPEVLGGFREYVSTLWTHCQVSPRERQTIILAVAATSGSTYEWQHHVRVAIDAGLSPTEIRAIGDGEFDQLPNRLATVAAYGTAFVDGTVDDGLHEKLANDFEPDAIVGLGMLAACYIGLARFIDAIDIDTEHRFVGWSLEGPKDRD